MSIQFDQRNIISINRFTKKEIQHVLELAKNLKANGDPSLLRGKIMGNCFFEPSTRTRLSFEAAMYKLGGNVIGFSDVHTTSIMKGETLYDSIKIIGQYVDVIVIRHPLAGAAQRATEATGKPVINAGDGTNQHPTQTFLDLFSIEESQGTLENLRIAMVGDLKNGRTVHSLAQACAHFNSRLYFVSPPNLDIPQEICHELRKKGIKFSFHRRLEEILDKVDVLYMTRIQKERFVNKTDYQKVKGHFILTADILGNNVQETLKVLHPLPRVDEICRSIDDTPYAYYFQQAENGLYVRQALLGLALGMFDSRSSVDSAKELLNQETY